jgi:hypothetical protein
MKWQTIYYKIDRILRHVLVIAYISAAGESLTPYIVISQDSPIVQNKLKKRDVRFGTNFILKSRAKPYINTEIFQESVTTVFLPNLNEMRSLEQFADKEVVLLMDNYPSHVSEVTFKLLRDARVRVITWPSHTTQIFQQFDLSLFKVLKQKGQDKLPFDNEQETANFLFHIYRTFRQTMIETNI